MTCGRYCFCERRRYQQPRPTVSSQPVPARSVHSRVLCSFSCVRITCLVDPPDTSIGARETSAAPMTLLRETSVPPAYCLAACSTRSDSGLGQPVLSTRYHAKLAASPDVCFRCSIVVALRDDITSSVRVAPLSLPATTVTNESHLAAT